MTPISKRFCSLVSSSRYWVCSFSYLSIWSLSISIAWSFSILTISNSIKVIWDFSSSKSSNLLFLFDEGADWILLNVLYNLIWDCLLEINSESLYSFVNSGITSISCLLFAIRIILFFLFCSFINVWKSSGIKKYTTLCFIKFSHLCCTPMIYPEAYLHSEYRQIVVYFCFGSCKW